MAISVSGSLGAMFFWLRTVRTPLTMSFTCSISAMSCSSCAVGASICNVARMMLSPSLRSVMCCHNSSVMKGIKGCNILSKSSKKAMVAS